MLLIKAIPVLPTITGDDDTHLQVVKDGQVVGYSVEPELDAVFALEFEAADTAGEVGEFADGGEVAYVDEVVVKVDVDVGSAGVEV